MRRLMAIFGALVIGTMALGATPVRAAGPTHYWVSQNARNVGAEYNTSCRDAFSFTLEDALSAYDEGDTIYLCSGEYFGTFSADNGTLTIAGVGRASKNIINADTNGRAITAGYLDTAPDPDEWVHTDLIISNVTIKNGDAEYGAAISANDFTCQSSVLVDNDAAFDGGAVWAGHAVNSNSCSYDSNESHNGSGGAIWAGYSVESFRDFFTVNQADDDGGAVEISGLDNGYSTFDKAYFYGNLTCGDGCSGWLQNGGAIHINKNSLGDLYVISSNFVENSASDDGGAIWGPDSISITTSTFTNNEAGDDGGAVTSYGDLYLYKSTFKANHANDEGGAFYALGDLHFIGANLQRNTADTSPGGVTLGAAAYLTATGAVQKNIGWSYSKKYHEWSVNIGASQFIYIEAWLLL